MKGDKNSFNEREMEKTIWREKEERKQVVHWSHTYSLISYIHHNQIYKQMMLMKATEAKKRCKRMEYVKREREEEEETRERGRKREKPRWWRKRGGLLLFDRFPPSSSHSFYSLPSISHISLHSFSLISILFICNSLAPTHHKSEDEFQEVERRDAFKMTKRRIIREEE